MNNFSDLGLSTSLVDVLKTLGFTQPTPVQQLAIPKLLSGSTDFIGLAQTGTGKTAAFGLPLMELVDPDLREVQAIVLAPTRELGQQTAAQLKQFSASNKSLRVAVVYGGANIVNQIKELKSKPQIVVATPGRLIDLLKRRSLQLSEVRYVVLDEADEMLNMGFQESIDEILTHTPEGRKTWLFSATMPDGIRKIVKSYMQNPEEVRANSSEKSNKDISHKYVVTKVSNKTAAIRRFMEKDPDLKGIMFCRTKRETQQLADELASYGYGVEALHGDLTQMQRDTVMKRFKSRSLQLMVATDVAARGIDVNDLTHVFHHTLPDQLEAYTHRSGRTGRAGKKGLSIAFINPREARKIKDLEKKVEIKFEKIDVPSATEAKSARLSQWAATVAEAEVTDEVKQPYESVQSFFENFSKEELIKKLVSLQMKQQSDTGPKLEHNLNEEISGGSRSSTPENDQYRKYFINLGSVDGFSKEDMIHLLSDLSALDRKHFGSVRVLKNRCYFEVDKQQDQGFSQKFQGVEFENRKVTVHVDREVQGSGSGERKKRHFSARKSHASPARKHDSRRSGRKKRR